MLIDQYNPEENENTVISECETIERDIQRYLEALETANETVKLAKENLSGTAVEYAKAFEELCRAKNDRNDIINALEAAEQEMIESTTMSKSVRAQLHHFYELDIDNESLPF